MVGKYVSEAVIPIVKSFQQVETYDWQQNCFVRGRTAHGTIPQVIGMVVVSDKVPSPIA